MQIKYILFFKKCIRFSIYVYEILSFLWNPLKFYCISMSREILSKVMLVLK